MQCCNVLGQCGDRVGDALGAALDPPRYCVSGWGLIHYLRHTNRSRLLRRGSSVRPSTIHIRSCPQILSSQLYSQYSTVDQQNKVTKVFILFPNFSFWMNWDLWEAHLVHFLPQSPVSRRVVVMVSLDKHLCLCKILYFDLLSTSLSLASQTYSSPVVVLYRVVVAYRARLQRGFLGTV